MIGLLIISHLIKYSTFLLFSFSGALAPVLMGGHVGITGAQLLVTGSAGGNAIAPGTAGPASPSAQPLPRG